MTCTPDRNHVLYFLVVHYAMTLLVSWAYSSEDLRPKLCETFAGSKHWLKKPILDAPDVSTSTLVFRFGTLSRIMNSITRTITHNIFFKAIHVYCL